MTAAQIDSFEKSINQIIKLGDENAAVVKELKERLDHSEQKVIKMEKLFAARGHGAGAPQRRSGKISEEGARALASSVIVHCLRSGVIEGAIPNPTMRDALVSQARSFLGVSEKAMTTAEVPLPTTFSGDLRELVAEFGSIRGLMFPYPLTGGVSRPPRFGTRPAFESIAMSGAFPEKKPTFGFASLESHKIGGYVLVPRELEDQSIVNMGQFLARYAAVEFARAEDSWALFADGTATYESVTGVFKIAADNGKLVTLGPTKTAPSDATLEHFRELRRKVNSTARKRGRYLLNHTWETRLWDLNTQANPNVFRYSMDGTAYLDGNPITWVEVMQEYTTDAAPSQYIAAFGDLQWWWFGERGSPRIDQSEHVAFLNDQIAVRFIEELDFDYQSIEAVSVMKTPAA